MRPRMRSWLAVSFAMVVCLLVGAPAASAADRAAVVRHAEPDAAEELPDGTDPGDPPGSFPHIPYYAIGCTLEDIAEPQRRPHGGRGHRPVRARPRHVQGHDQRARHAGAARTPTRGCSRSSSSPQRNPRRAQELIERRDVKVPIFIQGGIHGNEYEGVDAAMRAIERLATTPYGEDPQVDAWLDHAVLVFNVIQNPDGRDRGHARERQRLRPQPRLHHAVAARDDGVGRRHQGVVPDRGATTCTATSSRRSSRARRCLTTRASSTTSGPSGTSRGSTPTRPGSRARASASPGRSTTSRRVDPRGRDAAPGLG